MNDEEKVRRAYADPSPDTFIKAYAEAMGKREEPVYMKAFPKFVTVSEQTRLNVLKMVLTEEEYEQVVELYEKERVLKSEMA